MRDLIERACPAALTTPIEIRNQVPKVLAGLEATQAKLSDPAVKEALVTSRKSLETVALQIDSLDSYKNLHELLHKLQTKSFSDLRSIAKRLDEGPFYTGLLREYLEQLQTSCIMAHTYTDRLPDLPTVRGLEIDWINKLQEAAEKYQSALDASDARAILAALRQVRQRMRHEPFRLNKLIYLTAQGLPLENLMQTLQQVSAVVRPQRPELTTAYVSMRELRATLLGRVEEHKMWQDADNDIWHLEEMFGGPNEAREDFADAWNDVKGSVLVLSAMDPKAKWSQKIQEYSVSLDDAIAREEPGKELESAFDTYRREARFRFFWVDAQLRRDCEALVRIGEPLRKIIEALRYFTWVV